MLKNYNWMTDYEIGDYNGWVITKKKPKSKKFSDRKIYLRTHTFYEGNYQESTRILQACGFDVELTN